MPARGDTTGKATEERNPSSMQLSDMTAAEIVALMTFEERRVLDAISAVSAELATAAEKVAATYRSGGRTFFLGAGTSGRLAVMEAAELPPTFGVLAERFVALVAAGPSAGPAAVTSCEDDKRAGPDALGAAGCSNADAVIGLAASGTTRFVVSGVNAARSVGAWTCGLANNPDTPVLAAADLPILLDTGPEILTGSTRLKAGTAQKLALNRITTAALVRAGLVRSNLMINVSASNAKLRNRCVNIVSELTGASEPDAIAALEAGGWAVPDALAILERTTQRKALDTRSARK